MTTYLKHFFIGIILLFFLPIAAQYQPLIHESYKKEIRKLTRIKKVKKALQFIQLDESLTLKQHITLTEIPAPPFKEEKRAVAFSEMLKELKLDSVWIDEVGNVLGLIKGTKGKRTIAIDGHLDTVFPEGTDVSVKIKGDTLFAPGIADDTRALAMLLCMIRALDKAHIRTEADLLFVATVGEEGLGDLRGIKHIFSEDGYHTDSWIAIDGGSLGRINIQGLGSYRYKVNFLGPGGHSWGAFGLGNPHHALGDAINLFVEKADAFTSYGERTSYNVGRIGGGTSINSIPFESWMEVDIRSVNPRRLDSLETILHAAAQAALDNQNKTKRIGAKITLRIDKIGNRPSGELPSTIPIAQRAMAVTAYMGKRPKITRGSTNANIPIALGIPAVTLGRGGIGANAHSLDEWWIDKEAYKSIQTAFLLMISEAKLDK
ncbi:MAG: M20/M25/M40 family metallo-hydrolase [Saprospiraceae bacterium]